jgi:hypothetical protein
LADVDVAGWKNEGGSGNETGMRILLKKIRELLFYLVNSTDSGSPFGWKRR